MTYMAEGHRGTVYYGRAKPTGAVAGDVWVTWVMDEIGNPTHPSPRHHQRVYVWDAGWQPLDGPPAS